LRQYFQKGCGAALLACGLLLALLSFAPGRAWGGGVYQVTNTNDSGAGSLRNAINNWNGGAPAATDAVNFQSATAGGTINLLSALPAFTSVSRTVNDSGGSLTVVNTIANSGALSSGFSISLGGANTLNILSDITGASGAYGVSSNGADLTVGKIAGNVDVTARTNQNSAYGLYAAGNMVITDVVAGKVTATAGTHTAVGIQSQGTLNGGNAATAAAISGTVSASANGLAVAVASVGAMNLYVTGTLSGVDTSGGGAGYAIRAGKPDGAGGWIAGSGGNTLTLGTGANLSGKVDLGGGASTLKLVGSGATGVQFLGVTNLVAGDGANPADWSLTPDAGNASSFSSLTVNANAALTINENVTINGDTQNNGRLTFDIGTTKNYSGAISGTGSVTKAGAGVLYLWGANTYSGGTFVNAGTLNIVSDANLGDPTGALTFGGGTLQAGAPLTLARSIVVGPSGGTLDNAGYSVGLSGTLTGSGSLTFAGPGATVLSGDGSAYTGQAAVLGGALVLGPSGSLGGRLTVGAGAVIGGYGTVGNLANDGLVAPGGSIGTLNVAGSYVQGPTAVFYNEIDPSGAGDLLKVGGSAVLGGGLLYVSAPVAFYPTGQRWRTITATGGVSGAFAAAGQDFPSNIVRFLPVYTAGGVATEVFRTPYAQYAASGPAASAGNGLNQAAFAAAGDLAYALLTLDLAAPATAAFALSQLHPEPYDAFTQSGFDGGRLLTTAVQGWLHGLRTGGAPEAFASPFDASPAQTQAFNAASQGGPIASRDIASPKRTGVFLQTFGMTDKQGAARDRTGYGAGTWGMVGGMDFSPRDDLTAAVYGGYVGRVLWLGAPAAGNGRGDTFTLGAAASWFGASWFLEGSARVGYDTYLTQRKVWTPFGSVTANSSWNGWDAFASAAGGYQWRQNGWTFGPVASLEYAMIRQNGFGESGAGSLGLDLAARTDLSLQSSLGGRVAKELQIGPLSVTPELRVLWGHEWLGEARDIQANFQGAPAASFTTQTAPLARDWANVGAGVTVKFSERFLLTGRVSTVLFRRDYQSLAGSLGLRYSF
jgi:outer membrane autotransporter protein